MITPFYVEKFEKPQLTEEYQEVLDTLPDLEDDSESWPEYDDYAYNY